jgi:DNA-binding NarL/FixJ family response regulator
VTVDEKGERVNAPVYGALDRSPSGSGLTSGSVLPAPRSAGPDDDIVLRTISVLIADPDHATREPLAAGLSAVGVGSVLPVGSVEAVEEAARQQPAGDLALVSLLFGADAARLIATLRAAGWARVIALAPTADIGPVIDAVGAGVTGVLIGRRANPAAALLPSSIHDLSSREIEVIRLVADGRSNKWIGEQLSLSALTVKSHLARIGRKLGTGDRAHMVALAMRAGVIS